MRHEVTFPLYVKVNEIYNLPCSASPLHYKFDPVIHAAMGLQSDVKFSGDDFITPDGSNIMGKLSD
jgi:UDP-glucuronate decarboxylase